MPQSSEARVDSPDEVLEMVRTFEAPRPLVWRIFAEPQHRVRWWGPEGYALSHCEVDFRVGGAWSIAMKRVDGYEHWVRGVFREIHEPGRVAFTYVNDDDLVETLVTMDFIDLGAKTEMRFRQAPFADVETRDAHAWGWTSGLALLAEYVLHVSPVDPKPFGRPRIDGVAADIIAARERHEYELREGRKHDAAKQE